MQTSGEPTSAVGMSSGHVETERIGDKDQFLCFVLGFLCCLFFNWNLILRLIKHNFCEGLGMRKKFWHERLGE